MNRAESTQQMEHTIKRKNEEQRVKKILQKDRRDDFVIYQFNKPVLLWRKSDPLTSWNIREKMGEIAEKKPKGY